MTMNEIVTKQDLVNFKQDLIAEIQALSFQSKPLEKFLKSKDVKKILQCSDSTLQYFRQASKLKFHKVGGIYYYTQEAINEFVKKSE